ncbi:hypothetical protein [Actinacidiphila rubida]|uniref:Uncharacterized protein n=1 Tax=Actinacidiphila rubida TaxID=310780 RepID=A0A1H8MDK6_9ACTN|nr:hypothetical protein [Actinacidiphila rubida]SEO15374.1 hypothetical protein SAMN05216267_1018155 [Actinacidiphila rubida]
MGTDISGFVECRAWRFHEEEGEATTWHGVIDLFFLNTTRDYDAFGCLFGVRNYAGFRPLAADRGMPADASEAVRAELATLARWPDQMYGVTWITWAEVKRIDWDEPAETTDRRPHRYQRTPEGLRYLGKGAWDPVQAKVLAPSNATRDARDAGDGRPDGTEWTVGDTVYRAQRLRRRDAVEIGGTWQPVWTTMETLAALHGDDNVRLVVWFGN